MKRKRPPLYAAPLCAALLCAALLFGSCPDKVADTAAPAGGPGEEGTFTLGDMKVAAYINTWSSWKAASVEGQYLSDIILAFALINASNYTSIYMNFSGWAEVAELQKTWPDLKVTLSVGGATEKGFPNMTADAGKRATFINNVCTWMKSRNLDGVDIDWEFPNGSTQQANYITLLRETRDASTLPCCRRRRL